jgi:hypothetical protein
MGCERGPVGSEPPERAHAEGAGHVSVGGKRRRRNHRRIRRSKVQGDLRQGGSGRGVIWRWKDGNNYYVARANALENNVSLYYTANGRRNTIKYTNAPVSLNTWHTLRVEFAANTIRVLLNGKMYIEQRDSHIGGSGAVGLWTKADSVTAFDDFSYGTAQAK